MAAFGVSRAGDELPESPPFLHERLAALGTVLSDRLRFGQRDTGRFLRAFHRFHERIPEGADDIEPARPCAFHFVKVFFHARRKAGVHDRRGTSSGEVFLEEIRDRYPEFRGLQAFFLVLFDIDAIVERLHDGRVRRGASDALFLEDLDERGFGIACRGLRPALLFPDVAQRQLFSGLRGFQKLSLEIKRPYGAPSVETKALAQLP